MTLQHGIYCSVCGDEIFSNSTHDYVECRCGMWNINGGIDGYRVGGPGLDSMPEIWIKRKVDRDLLPRRYRNEVSE